MTRRDHKPLEKRKKKRKQSNRRRKVNDGSIYNTVKTKDRKENDMTKTNKTGEGKPLCEIKRTLQHVRKKSKTVKYDRKNDSKL